MTYDYHATVVRVIDGDTIVVTVDLGFRLTATMPLRLAGIDAPEVNAAGPEGEAARDWLRVCLPAGAPVALVTEKPRDKFGRYLAWVLLPGESISINEQLIRAGHAVAYGGGTR